jgi:hypothetical protein
MMINIMGLDDMEYAASGVTVVSVIVLLTSHAEISPWYFSSQSRFAFTVARAAVAAVAAGPKFPSFWSMKSLSCTRRYESN